MIEKHYCGLLFIECDKKKGSKMDSAIMEAFQNKSMVCKPLKISTKRIMCKLKRTFNIWSDYYNSKNILWLLCWIGWRIKVIFFISFSSFIFLLKIFRVTVLALQKRSLNCKPKIQLSPNMLDNSIKA